MPSASIERVLRILLLIIALVAIIGAVLVLLHASSVELAAFELITFGVGIAALTLATLGSMNSIHQTKVMRKIAREVHDTLGGIKVIDKENETIKRKLAQDVRLAHEIMDVLTESNMGDSEDERRHVAGKIEHRIRKK